MKIYIGNLADDVAEADLRELASPYGKVKSVAIVAERASGRRLGFAFVDMGRKAEAFAAIEGLNGRELKGRALEVSVAQSRQDAKSKARSEAQLSRLGAAQRRQTNFGPGVGRKGAAPGVYAGGRRKDGMKGGGGQARGR